MDQNESFSYTYSAKEQKEVEDIRKKYLPKEADKMEQLRRLDAIPHSRAQTKSLCVGILGALVMGTGMSLAMTDLGAALGIVIGLIGMVLVALAYPVYSRTLAKEQQKIAPEILRMTDELMK